MNDIDSCFDLEIILERWTVPVDQSVNNKPRKIEEDMRIGKARLVYS